MPQQPSSFVRIQDGVPMVDAGQLRHLVTIQQQVAGSDASGSTVTWQDFLTSVAAGIETVRGADVVKGGQVGTQLFLTVTIWYQPGVLPNMRVINESGAAYLIQAVENIWERNQVLVLNCLALGSNE